MTDENETTNDIDPKYTTIPESQPGDPVASIRCPRCGSIVMLPISLYFGGSYAKCDQCGLDIKVVIDRSQE